MDELKEEEGGSTSNEGEARVVMAHVSRLLEAGVAAADVGVITPYSAQVRWSFWTYCSRTSSSRKCSSGTTVRKVDQGV